MTDINIHPIASAAHVIRHSKRTSRVGAENPPRRDGVVVRAGELWVVPVSCAASDVDGAIRVAVEQDGTLAEHAFRVPVERGGLIIKSQVNVLAALRELTRLVEDQDLVAWVAVQLDSPGGSQVGKCEEDGEENESIDLHGV